MPRNLKKPPAPTCAADCDHYLYDTFGIYSEWDTEGSEDGDDY